MIGNKKFIESFLEKKEKEKPKPKLKDIFIYGKKKKIIKKKKNK